MVDNFVTEMVNYIKKLQAIIEDYKRRLEAFEARHEHDQAELKLANARIKDLERLVRLLEQEVQWDWDNLFGKP
jgi:polyhydroxyalkanoate synthesis regulator phasin